MSRSSPGAVADAVGHSILVFAFLPALVPVPHWLAFELANPLNRSDLVVLTQLPLRGAVLLLNVFWQGLVPGLVAGVLNGLVLAAVVTRMPPPATLGRALALGAATGVVAAVLMTGGLLLAGITSVPQVLQSTTIWELATDLACGALAAPKAIRLLGPLRAD